MKYFFLIIMFGASVTNASTESDIKFFFKELSTALNTHDFLTVEQSWTEEGELVTLAGGILKGNKNIKKVFKNSLNGVYKGARFHFYVQNIRIIEEGRALVDGVWKVVDGGPKNYPSCGIFLYSLNRVSGQWKIDLAYSSVPGNGHTREVGRSLSWTKICKAR